MEPEVVCVRVCDVCRELKHKHQVKLGLLSSWDPVTDSSLELTLVINQALHQGDVWKAESESHIFVLTLDIMIHNKLLFA